MKLTREVMQFRVFPYKDYREWLEGQTLRSKLQIEKRLEKIKFEGYFGHIKDLGDCLFELKFNDGRRVYYTILPVNNVILLLGGNKNGQSSDITKAKNNIQKAKKNHEKTF